MILMSENYNMPISAILMFEEISVADILIYPNDSKQSIKTVQIHNNALLPTSVKRGNQSIGSWLIQRCMPMNNRTVNITRFVTGISNKNALFTFLLSLSTNSISLVDRYWINVCETQNFYVDRARFVLNHTTWQKINPFKTQVFQAYDFELNDNFAYINSDDKVNTSAIWTTNGTQIKTWILRENEYCLVKRSQNDNLKKEITTFELCQKYHIKHPEYWIDNMIVEKDFSRYNGNTIQNGLTVINKKCLTNQTEQLIPISSYINDGDCDLKDVFNKIKQDIIIDQQNIINFIRMFEEHQQMFSVKNSNYDTSNFGILLQNNMEGELVVWSKLTI